MWRCFGCPEKRGAYPPLDLLTKRKGRRNTVPSHVQQTDRLGLHRSSFYLSGAGEPWADLRDLDLGLFTLLASRHKDDKTVDLGHSIAPSARLGNGDFVLLSDFYWLGSVVGWTAAKARSPVTASSTLSVTRSSFIS